MIISIDTNVVVYIVGKDPDYCEKAVEIFKKNEFHANYIICPIVYSELSAFFETQKSLDNFLYENNIRILPLSNKVLHKAGEKWLKYNKKRKVECPHCGNSIKNIVCEKCKKQVYLKQHIISDFIIGSFSQVEANKLFTFDKRIYKTYFPDLVII